MTLVHLPPPPSPLRPEAAALLKGVVDDLLRFARGRVAKAALPASIERRDAFIERFLADVALADLARYFDGQAARLATVATGAVGKAVERIWDPDSFDWSAEEEELRVILGRWLASVGVAGYAELAEQLALELAWSVEAISVRPVLEAIGERIRGITEVSRRLVASMVDLASERGYGIDQLVRGVPGDGFAGLADLVRSWGSPDGRAGLIASTELATTWNQVTLAGYRDTGLIDTVFVFDGTLDAPCAAANGATWTLERAMAEPLAHPSCQRAFAAVVAR